MFCINFRFLVYCYSASMYRVYTMNLLQTWRKGSPWCTVSPSLTSPTSTPTTPLIHTSPLLQLPTMPPPPPPTMHQPLPPTIPPHHPPMPPMPLTPLPQDPTLQCTILSCQVQEVPNCSIIMKGLVMHLMINQQFVGKIYIYYHYII